MHHYGFLVHGSRFQRILPEQQKKIVGASFHDFRKTKKVEAL
jgi:hypothetical protein